MKNLRRIIVIIALISTLVIGSAATCFADDGGYNIENYKFEGSWSSENVITVTETIKVNFYHKRHGIYRSIPQVFSATRDDGNGMKQYTYKADVYDISVDGENWTTSSESGFVDIRIGDKDKKIRGDKTYTIHYKYQIPDDRVKTADMLYFTVLGSGWNTPVKKFAFDMKFDQPLTDEELEGLQVLSGPVGVRENALGVTVDKSANGISGVVREVPANHAVTIAGSVHEGYFTGESHASKGLPTLFLILALLLFLAIIAMAFRNSRKVPKVTPTPTTPDQLCPAEAGTIIDEYVDDSDVLSMIPWFAQQGYLTMEEAVDPDNNRKKNREYVILHKVSDLPLNAPKYQKTLFYSLFPSGATRDMRDLDEEFGKKFDETKHLLEELFHGRQALSTGSGLALGLSFLLSVAIGGFVAFSNYLGFAEVCYASIFIIGCITAGACVVHSQKKHGNHGAGLIGRLIALVGCFGIPLVMAWAFCGNGASMYSIPFILGVVGMGILGAIISAWIIRPTDYKIEMMGKVLGLREYIKDADASQLESIHTSNPNLFYQVLPFAMVFGLTGAWIKKYSNISLTQPDWYQTMPVQEPLDVAAELVDVAANVLSAFNPQKMIDNMDREVMGSMEHSYDSFKASSSDGGSSGGGGGGGGGGSW